MLVSGGASQWSVTMSLWDQTNGAQRVADFATRGYCGPSLNWQSLQDDRKLEQVQDRHRWSGIAGQEIRGREWGKVILAGSPYCPFPPRTSRRFEQERMPLEQVRAREPVAKILNSYMQV